MKRPLSPPTLLVEMEEESSSLLVLPIGRANDAHDDDDSTAAESQEDASSSSSLTRFQQQQQQRHTWTVPEVLSLLLIIASLAWILFGIVVYQATPVAQAWHPAVALLCVGALWQAAVLVQGLRTALPKLLLARIRRRQQPQQSDVALLLDEIQPSHKWTHGVCELVVSSQDDDDDSRVSTQEEQLFALDSGAQVVQACLLLCLIPCTVTTQAVAPCSAVASTCLSSAATCIVWSAACQLATTTAADCALDTLNAPVMPLLARASLAVTRYACIITCSSWPRQVLPTLWQAWAEKAPKARSSSSSFFQAAMECLRNLCSLALTAAAVGILVLTSDKSRKEETTMFAVVVVVTVVACLFLASTTVAVPVALQVLTLREQEAANVHIMHHYASGQAVVVTACWITVAVLLLDFQEQATTAVLAARMASTLVLTMVASQVAQAVARSFPVAFLTGVQMMHAVTSGNATWVVAVADPAMAWIYPSYQKDDVYLGPTPVDVETPRANKTHIDSYPTPTAPPNAVVFEEHEF